ncbi:MAG: HPF/RaiA family ribosome-associated protein [Candidatus Paceibacterota bacterium]
MKTNIKATNITIASETADYLDKKLVLVEKIINDENMFCQIELGRTSNHHATGDVFRAEINCHSRGRDYRAVAEKESLHSAIDFMKDELVREIKTDKSIRQTMLRRGGAKIKNIIKGIYPFKKSR